MKGNKLNKYMILGLLVMSIKYFIDIPDDLGCFSTGIGIVLLGFGLYAMNNDISKLENWKRSLIERLTKRNTRPD